MLVSCNIFFTKMILKSAKGYIKTDLCLLNLVSRDF